MGSFNDWLDLLSLITPAFFFIQFRQKLLCIVFGSILS